MDAKKTPTKKTKVNDKTKVIKSTERTLIKKAVTTLKKAKAKVAEKPTAIKKATDSAVAKKAVKKESKAKPVKAKTVKSVSTKAAAKKVLTTAKEKKETVVKKTVAEIKDLVKQATAKKTSKIVRKPSKTVVPTKSEEVKSVTPVTPKKPAIKVAEKQGPAKEKASKAKILKTAKKIVDEVLAVSKKKDTPKRTRKRVSSVKSNNAGKKKAIKKPVAEVTIETPILEEQKINLKTATDVWRHYHDDSLGMPPPPEPPAIPDVYDDTRVVLLARDPDWLYCYWEISQSDRDKLDLGNYLNDKRLVLRFYKMVKTGFVHCFDIPVPDYAKDWYVHVPSVDEIWCVEIGILNLSNNTYMGIVRSNAMSTPRNTISDDTTVKWMYVDDNMFETIETSVSSLTDVNFNAHADQDSLLAASHIQTIRILRGSEENLLRVPIYKTSTINALSSISIVKIVPPIQKTEKK